MFVILRPHHHLSLSSLAPPSAFPSLQPGHHTLLQDCSPPAPPPRLVLSPPLPVSLRGWSALVRVATQSLAVAGSPWSWNGILGTNFSFLSFYVKERERCYNPLIYEHNPNKRNPPDSNPHQQIHRGLSEHCGRLWSRELPRSEPRWAV